MASLLRAENNLIKRNFLNEWVSPGSYVLDVGCGQGGDIHKWNYIGVNKLVGVDPNEWAIQEAFRRNRYDGFSFIVGDIRSAPLEQFDVVCYNFSLQYQPVELLEEVTKRLRRGGLFIGIVTDPSRLDKAASDGILVTQSDDPGKIRVYIPDTPYYANGPVTEPLLDKERFFSLAETLGLELQIWEPFSMYAKFVFVYKVE